MEDLLKMEDIETEYLKHRKNYYQSYDNKNTNVDKHVGEKNLAVKPNPKSRHLTLGVMLSLLWLCACSGIFVYVYMYYGEVLQDDIVSPYFIALCTIIVFLPLSVLWLIVSCMRYYWQMYQHVTRLENKFETIERPLAEINEHISNLLKRLYKQTQELQTFSEKTKESLLQYNQNIQDSKSDIEQASSRITDNLGEVIKSLQEQASVFARVDSSIISRNEDIKLLIEESNRLLQESLEHNSQWKSNLESFHEMWNASGSNYNDITSLIDHKLVELENTINNASSSLQSGVDGISNALMGKTQEAAQALEGIIGAGNEYIQKIAEVLNNVSQLKKNLRKESSEISSELLSRIDMTEEVVEKKEDFLIRLDAKIMDGIVKMEGNLQQSLSIFRDLDTATSGENSFSTRMRDILRELESVIVRFDSQTEELRIASENANAQLLEEETMYKERRQDIFLDALKHVFDNLYSDSLEIIRFVDETVSTKDLQKYKSGDKSIFTRSLLKKDSGVIERKLNEQILNNTHARNYVMQFTEDFEKLLNDAASKDPSGMLYSTFLTSSVGKLYLILCRSLGRVSK